ncbi:MAG TPA: 30S ribosomal protein S17, partial [Firmicutes bacterium]|nr:30S ribosomal protein S17 [Bacillota bacterium]
MTEAKEKQPVKIPARKVLKGRVVSDRMQKTLVVAVDRRKQHPDYDKIITRTRKYLVHDPVGEAGIGDFVQIEET